MMIDISKAFATYNIPIYKREYSWEAENVEQLMEDIFNGVKSLVEDPKDIRDRAITSWEQSGFEARKVDCVFLARPTVSVLLYS